MKSLRNFLPMLALVAFIASCKKDVKEEAYKKVQFKVTMGSQGQPAKLGDTTALNASYRLNISQFKFYLSDITVIDGQGNETPIKDVVLVDFNENDSSYSFSATLPTGDLKHIRMGIGVDSIQNNADPGSFNSNDHPLATYQGTYWTMLKYRFAIFEGKAFSKNDNNSYGLAYHTGTDPLYRQKTFDLGISDASAKLSYNIDMVIDLPTLFDGPGGKLDFKTQASTHSTPSEIHIADIFMENLKEAMELKTPVSGL